MENNKPGNTKSALIILFIFLLCVVVYGIWESNIRSSVSKNGVYTKCLVREVLGYKGGVRIEIEYMFKGIHYTSNLNFDGKSIKEGDQYFIMLSPQNPKIIVLNEKIVQDCLLEKEVPENGWHELPTCDK